MWRKIYLSNPLGIIGSQQSPPNSEKKQLGVRRKIGLTTLAYRDVGGEGWGGGWCCQLGVSRSVGYAFRTIISQTYIPTQRLTDELRFLSPLT